MVPSGERRAILLVDDDERLLRSLARGLETWPGEVLTATNLHDAAALMRDGVDIVVTDVVLGDECGLDVALEAVKQIPKPVILAMSAHAEPRDAFELGQVGVREYLSKPITSSQLRAAIVRALDQPSLGAVPDLRDLVGRSRLPDVTMAARDSMIEEALARASGNITKAAELLGISRQQLQNTLRRRRVPRRFSRD